MQKYAEAAGEAYYEGANSIKVKINAEVPVKREKLVWVNLLFTF